MILRTPAKTPLLCTTGGPRQTIILRQLHMKRNQTLRNEPWFPSRKRRQTFQLLLIRNEKGEVMRKEIEKK